MLESFGKIEPSFYRSEKSERCFRLCRPWHSGLEVPLFDAGIKTILLSYHDGWRAKNVDFLLNLPFISCVELYGYLGSNFEPIDLSAVAQCAWLVKLCININNNATYLPAFSRLLNLEILEVFLYRQMFCEDLNNAALRQLHVTKAFKLSSLNLTRLKHLNYLHFRDNKALEDVAIEPNTDLQGFEACSNRRLRAVEGLSEINSNCQIWLGNAHVFELDKLPNNARSLDLNSMGEIPCLNFLTKLENLEHISIFGTTDILDGDLSVLLSLPKLRSVNMRNRTHYSHKQDEIRAILKHRRDSLNPGAA